MCVLFFDGVGSGGICRIPREARPGCNYVGPGGLMDVTSRKFVSIAAKYTDATSLLRTRKAPADSSECRRFWSSPPTGTRCLRRRRRISPGADLQKDVNEFIWGFEDRDAHAGPGVPFRGQGQPSEHVEAVHKDAMEKNGAQLWTGPAAGGNDHLLAMKVISRE